MIYGPIKTIKIHFIALEKFFTIGRIILKKWPKIIITDTVQ